MALVEVEESRRDAHRVQRAHATDAQQCVLGEAYLSRSLVQPGRHPSLQRIVLGQFGVEQVERRSTHVHQPHVGGQFSVPDRHRHPNGGPVGTAHTHRRHLIGVHLGPVLVLPTGEGHSLVQVATSVQQSDPDDVERLVRRLLQDVTGENTETARVDGQRRMDAELCTEEGHWSVGLYELRGTLQFRVHALGNAAKSLEQLRVVRRAKEVPFGLIPEEPHGVLPRQRETVGVDAAKQVTPSRGPRPHVVVGDPRQVLKRLGQPARQAIYRPSHVARAVEACIHPMNLVGAKGCS